MYATEESTGKITTDHLKYLIAGTKLKLSY